MNPVDPRTEEDLEHLAQNGLLEESHGLDLKRELGSGNAANKDLAKDIAAFSLDGGTILIGVDEDTSPPGLWPVPIHGLAERIEQIAGLALATGRKAGARNPDLRRLGGFANQHFAHAGQGGHFHRAARKHAKNTHRHRHANLSR